MVDGFTNYELRDLIVKYVKSEYVPLMMFRYGLDNGKKRTIYELNKMFPEYSRESISQLDKAFKNKIKEVR